MAEKTRLLRPAAGHNSVVSVGPDARLEFAFHQGDANLSKEGQDLVLGFDDGGVLTLQGFYDNFGNGAQPPTLIVEGGELPGEAFLAALNNPDLMPAADHATGQVLGGGVYVDAVLAGIDGVDGLGTLDFDGWAGGTEAPTIVRSVVLAAEGNVIYGSAGNDVIHGGDSDNRIYGGAGDDVIYAGKGANILTGGEGDDIFAYIRADMDGKTDTITDFHRGKDTLRFDDLFAENQGTLDQLLSVKEDAPNTFIGASGDSSISLTLDSAVHMAAVHVQANLDQGKTIVLENVDFAFAANNEAADAAKLLHEIITVGG